MKKTITDSAFYVTKTMFFFLFVGGLVGSVFALPFLQIIILRPYRFSDNLFTALLGYVVVGMPVASFTGLLYGICLAFFQQDSVRRALSAIGCGIAPSVLFMTTFGWNLKDSRTSLIMLCCLMLFTGFASLVTAWVHLKAQLRFKFLRASGNPQEENGQVDSLTLGSGT